MTPLRHIKQIFYDLNKIKILVTDETVLHSIEMHLFLNYKMHVFRQCPNMRIRLRLGDSLFN